MVPISRPERKALRLQEYDYSEAGAYYITLCVQNREYLFGEVVKGEMALNDAGRMILQLWQDLPEYYPHIVLDAFVIMPNHVHGIIVIEPIKVGEALVASRLTIYNGRPQGPPLHRILNRFKSTTTLHYIRGVRSNGWKPFEGKLWQRGYYDHIIRDEADLYRVGDYIANNPLNWEQDNENLQEI